jgi:hypothetical protein
MFGFVRDQIDKDIDDGSWVCPFVGVFLWFGGGVHLKYLDLPEIHEK